MSVGRGLQLRGYPVCPEQACSCGSGRLSLHIRPSGGTPTRQCIVASGFAASSGPRGLASYGGTTRSKIARFGGHRNILQVWGMHARVPDACLHESTGHQSHTDQGGPVLASYDLSVSRLLWNDSVKTFTRPPGDGESACRSWMTQVEPRRGWTYFPSLSKTSFWTAARQRMGRRAISQLPKIRESGSH